MGLLTRVRDALRATTPDPISEGPAPIAELKAVYDARNAYLGVAEAARKGYEYGIPRGGTGRGMSGYNATWDDRRQLMEAFYGIYTSCPWSSACVDSIARTATAGGLRLTPDPEIIGPDGQFPEPPPAAAALRNLLDTVNSVEDLVQLLRGVVTDLEIFGDGYLEVVRVLDIPVELYSLDAASMVVEADEHGAVTGYTQRLSDGREIPFGPDDVIHISLDNARGGLYGVGPTEKALLACTSWLFMAAWNKQYFKQGARPSLHVDFGGMDEGDIKRTKDQIYAENLGVQNVGNPLYTTRGAVVNKLKHSVEIDFLAGLHHYRDIILSVYGVPPSKVSVIESGNIGGGTHEGQDKTFRYNTCVPIQNLLLEKLNFHLVKGGFGIEGWKLQFVEVDWRDSAIVEEIRLKRLKSGAYTLNRWRAEIGEPGIGPDGDIPIFSEGRVLTRWSDLAAGRIDTNQMGADGQPAARPDDANRAPPPNSDDTPGAPGDGTQGSSPREQQLHLFHLVAEDDARRLAASFDLAYKGRRRQVLKELAAAGAKGEN